MDVAYFALVKMIKVKHTIRIVLSCGILFNLDDDMFYYEKLLYLIIIMHYTILSMG